MKCSFILLGADAKTSAFETSLLIQENCLGSFNPQENRTHAFGKLQCWLVSQYDISRINPAGHKGCVKSCIGCTDKNRKKWRVQ